MKKTVIGIIFLVLIVLSSYIVTAPIWYGSGDDAEQYYSMLDDRNI